VTYVYRSTPHDITHPRGGGGDGTASSESGGQIDPAIIAARARGVLFDVGFGGRPRVRPPQKLFLGPKKITLSSIRGYNTFTFYGAQITLSWPRIASAGSEARLST
jgi:hypothetical protein